MESYLSTDILRVREMSVDRQREREREIHWKAGRARDEEKSSSLESARETLVWRERERGGETQRE